MGIWTLLIYLFSLKLIKFYEPINDRTLALLGGSIVTFLIAWFLAKLFIKRRRSFLLEDISRNQIEVLVKYLSLFLRIWLVGNVLTIVVQSGFPILWLFIGSVKTYADYGLPTFNGLLNALFAFLIVGNFFVYKVTGIKKYRNIVLILLTFPILIMSRGLLVLVVFELLGAYLFIKRLRIRNLFFLVGGIFSFVYLFGLLGDLRLGETKDIVYELVEEEHLENAEKVPSGFIWAYLYSTVSLNNVVYNIKRIEPNYLPYHSTVSLFPSVVRNLVFGDKKYEDRYSLEMANASFNTFTYFANYLKDFGVELTLAIVFIFQIFISRIYLRAKNMELGPFLVFPILYMAIMLSIFSDYFMSLPTIFQIFISFYVGRKMTASNKELSYV